MKVKNIFINFRRECTVLLNTDCSLVEFLKFCCDWSFFFTKRLKLVFHPKTEVVDMAGSSLPNSCQFFFQRFWFWYINAKKIRRKKKLIGVRYKNRDHFVVFQIFFFSHPAKKFWNVVFEKNVGLKLSSESLWVFWMRNHFHILYWSRSKWDRWK